MQGRVALVTGGANGIGRATVRAFLKQGAKVAIADFNEAALKATVAEFSAIGPEILPLPVDLSKTDRLEAMMGSVVSHFGKVDYLVNSAAILGGTYSLLELDGEEWDRMLQMNLKMPMLLMQAFAKHAIKRGGGGRIVIVTSSSAFRAQRTRPSYGTAKGGLTTLVRIAAAQLGEHDINVNAVAPGITNTPGATSERNVDINALRQKVSEGPNANFFKRLTEAEDVAETIVFLCGPGSRQITGQTVHVSAGTITP